MTVKPLKFALVTLLLGLLILLGSIPSCGRSVRSVEPETGLLKGRDLILVVADSFHARHSSAYGYPRPTTPFLDSLAARGVRAERMLSQTSWTLSSVVTLLTGLVQERHGVLLADHVLAADGPATLAGLFRAAGYRTVAFVENAVVSPERGLGRDFDRYEYIRFLGPDGAEEVQRRTQAILAEADARPLFLYVHLLPPHMPYVPPEPYLSSFRADPGLPVQGSTAEVQRLQSEQLGEGDPGVVRLVELYDGHIAFADERIRRLVGDRLEGETGSRTAVLVTSDHGEAFMQHGRTGHNATVYEEMVHVPWILAAPGAFEAGGIVRGPATLVDTLPTLAQLFDLRLPAAGLDGRSLAPRFDGSAPTDERSLYLSSRYPGKGKSAQFALVRGAWKLVTRRRGMVPELFDVVDDPAESRDRTSDFPALASELAAVLAELRSTLARESATSLTAPLTETMLDDLEALGYGGAQFDQLDAARRR